MTMSKAQKYVTVRNAADSGTCILMFGIMVVGLLRVKVDGDVSRQAKWWNPVSSSGKVKDVLQNHL